MTYLKISKICIENVQLNHIRFLNDTTLASDNPFRFRKNLFRIYSKNHDNDQIRDEKLQYHINRETAKISAWSCGKINKYEYRTGENILPSNQQQIIKQSKIYLFSFGERFWKTNKNNWRSR